jgi:hypothetical protein
LIIGLPGYVIQILVLLVAIGCFWLPPRRIVPRCYLYTATAIAALLGVTLALALFLTSAKS